MEQAGLSGRCPRVCSEKDCIIHVDCASHVYPDGTLGIHDMCFSVCRQEIVALCGANGSGKSTLLEHLNGLMMPSTGSVYVLGKPCQRDQEDGLEARRPRLPAPGGSAFRAHGAGRRDVRAHQPRHEQGAGESRRAGRAGYRSALPGWPARYPNYLSGGEKRLVAIAGVLVMKPEVICMDEPTSDLDDFHRRRIEELILQLRNVHGISLVIATHDADMAGRLADRVCIVRGGSIVAEGPPGDIFYDRSMLLGAGLTPPEVVDIYLNYCDRQGIVPTERPVTMAQLLNVMAR